MARPIKETPILYGEDARRFRERMREKRHEDPEKRERRLKIYDTLIKTMKTGARKATARRKRTIKITACGKAFFVFINVQPPAVLLISTE